MAKLDERPWFKFRPDRWLGDAALQSCSLEAQGLWINLCALMHNSTEYGHLLYKGRPSTAKEIVKELPRLNVEQVNGLIKELENEEVLRRRESDGCIFSKRMVEDRRAAEEGSQNASAGHEARKKQRSRHADDLPPVGTPVGHKKESKKESKNKSESRARAKAVKLPLPFEPRENERLLAFNDLKMTSAEYDECLAEFVQWASTKGRKCVGEPDWNRTFANDLRRTARSWGTSFRKTTPSPIAIKAKVSRQAIASEQPTWFANLGERFAGAYEAEWSAGWSRCVPVSEPTLESRTVILRAHSPEFYSMVTRKGSRAVEKFKHATGYDIELLPPERTSTR